MSWPECHIPSGVFVPGSVLDEQSRAVSVELGCSRNEATGIILSLWMFATEAEDGIVRGNRHALMSAIMSKLDDRVDATTLLEHLEKAGVISSTEDTVEITGYVPAQEPIKTLRLYNAKLAEKRRLDMERKQRKRAEQKDLTVNPQGTEEPPANLLEIAGVPADPPKAKSKPRKAEKPEKAEKIKYAEYVSLTPSEHEKLVEKFGAEATQALIEKLDNAKGARGYKYKSDYRAILNWVVDEVKRTKPMLFTRSAPVQTHDDNPF